MTEHRVASHLRVDATSYDAAIRQFVPHYETMIGIVIEMLDAVLPREPLVIDLGAGTGALAGAILDAIPRARVMLVDIDPNMLEVARARVARHGARAELRVGSFHDPLPPSHAIVASLSLHHVPEIAAKRTLYGQIHDALQPGGVFLSADAAVHNSGPERDWMTRRWIAWMVEHGISEPDAREHLAQWAGEDFYFPLATELALLADAGFAHPECFWKHGPSTVFGAYR